MAVEMYSPTAVYMRMGQWARGFVHNSYVNASFSTKRMRERSGWKVMRNCLSRKWNKIAIKLKIERIIDQL